MLVISSAAFLLVACGSDEPGAADGTGSTIVVTRPPTTTPATDSPTATEPPATPEPAATEPPTTEPATTATLPDNPVVIDDVGFGSLEEMTAAADLVVYGTVTDETSLGRPQAEADPMANEFVGLTVTVESMLKGEPLEEVLLGWDAYVVGDDGERAATNVMNGIDVPQRGDQILLFLRPLDSEPKEFMGGFPTHALVSLDGIGFVEDGTVTVTDELSGHVIGLEGMTVAEITSRISAS